VRLWIDDPKYRGNFAGVLDKAASFQEGERWAEILVYDDNKCTHLKTEKPKFGGSEFGARLENDRKFAQDLCKRAGVQVGFHKEFKTGNEVLRFLKENAGTTYVVKPQGGKSESHHLIIGDEGRDDEMLAQVQRLVDMGLVVDSWEVEEKQVGQETALMRYFNGQDWVGPAALNFEHKHIATGNIGGLCGEAGTLVKYLETDELFDKTLGLLTPALRAADYRGIIDMNFIVKKDGSCSLIELTPRPGKPIGFILEELRITPLSKIFYACATGENLNMQVRWDWAVGAVLFAFGFPFEKVTIEASQGLPINGLPESLAHVHLMQVRRDKSGWKVGYGEGYILVATGRGEQIYDAKRRAYDAMAPVRVPNSQHRLDISDKIDEWDLRDRKILPPREEEPATRLAVAG
jgi:phosphoribosylamine--glycine ligase